MVGPIGANPGISPGSSGSPTGEGSVAPAIGVMVGLERMLGYEDSDQNLHALISAFITEIPKPDVSMLRPATTAVSAMAEFVNALHSELPNVPGLGELCNKLNELTENFQPTPSPNGTLPTEGLLNELFNEGTGKGLLSQVIGELKNLPSNTKLAAPSPKSLYDMMHASMEILKSQYYCQGDISSHAGAISLYIGQVALTNLFYVTLPAYAQGYSGTPIATEANSLTTEFKSLFGSPFIEQKLVSVKNINTAIDDANKLLQSLGFSPDIAPLTP